MSVLSLIALVLTVLAAIFGTLRLFLGPTTPDRVVAADILTVITTPALAWLAIGLDNAIYLDIALVYAALSFVGVVALARALEGPRT